MSFARELLFSIADQMGRPRQDLEMYIKALEKNWFDSKSAMRDMKQKDFDKLDFPSRLSGMIMERLGTNNKFEQQPKMRSEKMQIENPISENLNSVRNRLSKSDFNEVVSILMKIFSNIRNNVTEQKYRTLKKSNEKIGKLISIREAESILRYGGFQAENIGFVMRNVNLALLDECVEEIGKHVEKVQFNPYAATITSIGQSTVKQYQGESSVAYNDKLAELQKERQKMMSKPIKDRQIKVLEVKPENREKMELEFNEKEELNEDERIYMQNVKEILKKAGQDPKFMNRRKKEYFDLLKQPCYTETLVRVKLPDNYVFECKMSPLQTLQNLVDLFHENLEKKDLNYHLYMTPPVQNLRGVILRKTFYELGCVPRAIFYFKTEDKIKGNIMKNPKKGFLGFFS